MGDLPAFTWGDVVLVETTEVFDRRVTRAVRRWSAVIEAGKSLEQVVGRNGPIVKGIVAEIRESAEWPDEVEVEFSQ